MKKIFVVLLLVMLLLFASCTPDIVAVGGVVVQGERPTPTLRKTTGIVYVTKSGSKYHLEDCAYLSDSKIPILREQAIAEGKTPCSKCHPDTTSAF